MNDIAEAGLRGVFAVSRRLRARPMSSFGVAGLVVSVVVVVAGGRVAALQSNRSLSSWFGLQQAGGVDPDDRAPGVVMFVALVVLVVLWIALVQVVRHVRPSGRRMWAVAGAWALPFVLGPPLLDTSVYSYVAFARLVRFGRDPYSTVPSALGSSSIVGALTPGERDAASSSGPLGTLLQHLSISISGGKLLGAVVVLRAVGVLAAIAIGRAATRLGGGEHATPVALVVLNPLTLLYVISSPHLEGVTVAVALAAAVAARRRRWTAAVGLAAIAGSVTGPGLVAVPLMLAAHWIAGPTEDGPPPRRRLALAGDVAVVVLVGLATRVITADGFGWLRNVTGQFDQHTPFAVSDAIGRLISFVVPAASYDDLAAGGRLTAAVAAVAVLGYLLVTIRTRSLEVSIGCALLGVALLAPVLHPWYLMWGVLMLAPTATGRRRVCVLALSAAACLLTPPGFTDTTSSVLTAVTLAVIALVAGCRLAILDRRARLAALSGAAGSGTSAAR